MFPYQLSCDFRITKGNSAGGRDSSSSDEDGSSGGSSRQYESYSKYRRRRKKQEHNNGGGGEHRSGSLKRRGRHHRRADSPEHIYQRIGSELSLASSEAVFNQQQKFISQQQQQQEREDEDSAPPPPPPPPVPSPRKTLTNGTLVTFPKHDQKPTTPAQISQMPIICFLWSVSMSTVTTTAAALFCSNLLVFISSLQMESLASWRAAYSCLLASVGRSQCNNGQWRSIRGASRMH